MENPNWLALQVMSAEYSRIWQNAQKVAGDALQHRHTMLRNIVAGKAAVGPANTSNGEIVAVSTP